MKGQPTKPWGKRDKETGEWHPLLDHCADVAAVVEALLERTLMRRRLAYLAKLDDLSTSLIARLCFFAALHDIGKHNTGFQARFEEGRPKVGHVKPAIWLLDSRGGSRPRSREFLNLLPPDMLSWGDAGLEIFLATLCHHGLPYPLEISDFKIGEYWKSEKAFEGLREHLEAAARWFPEAFGSEEQMPTAVAFQHGWNGLLTLADWLGSDPTFFPFRQEGDERCRTEVARPAARHALRAVGLDVEASRLALGAEVRVADLVGEPVEARPGQRAASQLPSSAGGSLSILEASTGSGKTEAALLRFLDLFRQGEVDGLYFALPTRTAATQIHRRVTEAMRRVFQDAAPPVIQAVPGYLKVDDVEGERPPSLPRFEVLWPEEPGMRERHELWAAEHPKRYLAGPIVVGTIDQVLLSTLRVRHAHLRAAPLLRHLLVVDEVHASDAYMERLLREVLSQHRAAGGHAFLMSATLGGAARSALFAGDGSRAVPSLDDCLAVPYPVLTHQEGTAPPRHIPFESDDGTPSGKAVQVELMPLAEDPAAVAALALEAASTGARVLVVRSTVGGCRDVQRALEEKGSPELLLSCADRPAPHHSRFAREDRRRLDEVVEGAFHRKRPDRGGVVVSATQTVEQSLDLDADLLITDLAPMDVLIQRIGRLHRHFQEWRPPCCKEPKVLVLVPAERDLAGSIGRGGAGRGRHGLGTVYGDLRILEATWSQLEDRAKLRVPTDCRELVERATHPEALRAVVASAAEEAGEAWKKHESKIRGETMAEGGQAKENLVSWRQLFGDLSFDSKDRVPTRLGEDDLLVRFEEPVVGPFGEEIRQLTVPAHLLGERDEGAANPRISSPQLEQRGDNVQALRFTIDDRVLIYDRLGLRLEEG